MTERIAFGAIFLLIAAHAITQSMSPAATADVGTYVAQAVDAEGPHVLTLTLSNDSSATLVTESAAPGGKPVSESGTWLLSGTTIQVALTSENAGTGVSSAVFQSTDGHLVGPDPRESESRFAGVVFVRQSPTQ